MEILLLLVVIVAPRCVLAGVAHEFIGCYKDSSTRAMPVSLPTGSGSLLEGCKNEAEFRGYEVFGIQNGIECWSGPNAQNTYDKYGTSTACSNGIGGPWANDVYRIKSGGAALVGALNDMIANASSIDDVDVGAFVSQSSKVLELSNSEWKENPKVADSFLSATQGLLTLGMSANSAKSATTDAMVFSVSKENTSNKESVVFPDYNNAAFSKHLSTNSFVVPTIDDETSTNIGGYVYDNLHEKLKTSLNKTDQMYRSDLRQDIASKVLSCQVNPPIKFGINTNETILITLEHNQPMSSEATPICAFWKHGENNQSGLWSTEGCNVISSNESHTRCNCTHLTNFAILMQYEEVEIDDGHVRALSILTRIGCVISLIAIFVTITIFLVYKLYRSKNFLIHLNLCFAIAFAQLFLLFSDNRTNKNACVVISFCLHYFCLCVFTWMLVEGLQIYKKVVSVFSSTLHSNACFVIGWGVPVPIVLITYLSRPDHYTHHKTCWLSPEYGIRWAFIGPVFVVFAINSIVTCITLRKRLQLRTVEAKSKLHKLNSSVRALFILMPIFGLTWIIGIFGFTSHTVAAMYIFVVLNTTQGLMIFILHCAMNAEVRKVVFPNSQIHTRNGTLTNGSKKPPLQKIPSKNSDCSNKDTSRHSSARSMRENGQDDIHMADHSAAIITPQSLQSKSHLVP